jgi:hypothetical protein
VSSSTPDARHYQVVPATANRAGGATNLPTLVLYKADGTPYAIPTKQAAQADSTAPDVATLKTDFNALLAKLRLAGILS